MLDEKKRFYWLKLNEDFFHEDTIEWLEEQENGKEYVLFYLKLCLKAMNSDGILIRQIGKMLVPYEPKKLADMTRTSLDTVMIALEVLKNIGLIEIQENGTMFIPRVKMMIGSETLAARRKREQRNSKDEEPLEELDSGGTTDETTGGTEVGQCPIEIEIRDRDRDRDKSIEIDIDIDKEKETPKGVSQKKVNTDFRCPYQTIMDSFNAICVSYPKLININESRKKAIKARWLEYGKNTEVFTKLFKKAEASNFLKGANPRNWSANFDWLINSRNMLKVLEGNYDNLDAERRPPPKAYPANKNDADDTFEKIMQKWEREGTLDE